MTLVAQTDALASAIGTHLATTEDRLAALEAVRSVNTQVAEAYTFALTDAGNIVDGNRSTAQTFTIPTNAAVAFPVGTEIEGCQFGDGQITIVGDTGVTLHPNIAIKTHSRYAVYGIRKQALNVWIAYGKLAAA